MEAQMLVDQTAASGLPAPDWFVLFVQFFKVLGFTLHLVPMNLWYAGIMVALLLQLRGGDHGGRFASRLMKQMPVIVALGVNFGVVPLLFTQLAYYRVFYPATILIAWPWLAMIALLIPAYYGVYIYATGFRENGAGLTPWKKAAGWSAAVFFILIGFLFANGFSLMAHVQAWPELWLNGNTGGAALGTALNVADRQLWPRWLLLFGLALTTTAAWMRLDAAWLAGKESNEYKQWASRFSAKLYTVGMVWFAAAGSWYAFGTWPGEVQTAMSEGPRHALTIVTAMSPGLPWVLLWVYRSRPASRTVALLIGLAQLGVLGVNAISRQVVQDLSLRGYLDVADQLGDAANQLADVQWSPLIAFLVLFVAGLGVVVWMIAQVVKASSRPIPFN